MADEHANLRRRRLLLAATTTASGAAAAGAAVPFVRSMMPSEAARAAGAPVEADISTLGPGQKLTIAWRGKPVWIVHRTRQMLDSVRTDDDRVADPQSQRSVQPPYAQNEFRSIKPEYLVVIGICTHLGCSPVDRFQAQPEPFDPSWHGGFYCPCHGSLFDLAGRVYKNKPAPTNLVIPPYQFVTSLQVRIGDDKPQA